MVSPGPMYFAVCIRLLDENSYEALVPDIPGCTAKGVTAARLLTDIHLAIEVKLAELLGKGGSVPSPRHLRDFQNETRYRGCEWYSVHINVDHLRGVAKHQTGRWN